MDLRRWVVMLGTKWTLLKIETNDRLMCGYEPLCFLKTNINVAEDFNIASSLSCFIKLREFIMKYYKKMVVLPK